MKPSLPAVGVDPEVAGQVGVVQVDAGIEHRHDGRRVAGRDRPGLRRVDIDVIRVVQPPLNGVIRVVRGQGRGLDRRVGLRVLDRPISLQLAQRRRRREARGQLDHLRPVGETLDDVPADPVQRSLGGRGRGASVEPDQQGRGRVERARGGLREGIAAEQRAVFQSLESQRVRALRTLDASGRTWHGCLVTMRSVGADDASFRNQGAAQHLWDILGPPWSPLICQKVIEYKLTRPTTRG